MILLDPTSEGLKDSYNLAPRKFRSLDGVRLGLLGNSKLNADKILDAVGEMLAERYAVMPHPIGNLRPDQIRQRAEALVDDVLSILGVTEPGTAK